LLSEGTVLINPRESFDGKTLYFVSNHDKSTLTQVALSTQPGTESKVGTPFTTITSASASMTFAELHLRSDRIIRHSRLCSSIRLNIRTVLPSYVFALTKS